MVLSPQWEYMSVLVSTTLLGSSWVLHPYSVNGQELKNWKTLDLNIFLGQLGAEHWEMTGTISVSRGEFSAEANYLFFKRIKP